MASFRTPVCFINFGLIPYRQSFCTLLYYCRACVDAWASAASDGSFKAVAPVAIWDTALILCGGLVLYGKVPNNAYSQGSQELSVICGCLSTRLAHLCPGTGRCLPPPHASLRPCFICTVHRSQACTCSRKLTSRVVIITSLKYLRVDLLHKT